MNPRRESVLKALYESETSPASFDLETVPARARKVVEAILESVSDLDEAIEGATLNWSLNRIAPVDLQILRQGLYELRTHPDTPTAVILDEAVELAKKYSTAASSSFVNGVLAKLAKVERP